MSERLRELMITERQMLLEIARRSIEHRLRRESPEEPEAEGFPSALQARRSSFVTLEKDRQLRGCCGSLEASRPLVLDVWASAQAAAFSDHRFSPLEGGELAELAIEVSVLTPLRAVGGASEAELLESVVPGLHGLYLRCGDKHATFLPKVWESLPDAQEFLHNLKLKAGFEPGFWSSDMQCFVYRTECFSASFVRGTDA